MRTKTLGMLAVATCTLAVAAPAMAAPPANDSFADAKRATIGRSYTGSVVEARPELGEPAHAGQGPFHSVWFRYKARRTGRLTIDTGTSEFDTTLSVYTGGRLANLHVVAEDDDRSPSGNLGSTVRFNASRGRTYRIAIDSFSQDAGSGRYALWISDGSIRGKDVRLNVPAGHTLEGARSRGVQINVSARRRVGVGLQLRVSRRIARRLGLRSQVLGRARGVIDYGQSLDGVITLTRAARRALRGEARLNASVRLELLNTRVPDRFINVRVPLS